MPSDSDTQVMSVLELGEPPQEVLEYAKRELGEDPETRCQILSEFRDLIYERGECTPHRMDDAFLLRFLRAKYFVVRHAHRMLVNYYQFKENNPQYTENVYALDMKKMGEYDLITVPPYREQTGRRILLYKWGKWDTEKITITELFQATLLILELAILEQQAQILGGIVIFDFAGLTKEQAWNMTPTIAKKVFQLMVTSFPLRPHAVHVVNQPWIFGTLFNFFKPLANEKMTETVFIHGDDMESLHKHIDPKYLPVHYGGVHPDYDYNEWVDFFLGSEDIRFEIRRMGYLIDENDKDDSKIGKLENIKPNLIMNQIKG